MATGMLDRIEDKQVASRVCVTCWDIKCDGDCDASTPPKPDFTFSDIFAGIGGFRLGLEALGGKCVYSCEWDKFCQQTYEAWFGEKVDDGDIYDADTSAIPHHTILTAGFPCQPFSMAGRSKKESLGQPHGFRDKTQGTLFFKTAEVIESVRPSVVLLENVRGLLSHDKGNTWRVILDALDELGYDVYHKVIDASSWVPQHRERVFIVGFRRGLDHSSFRFPTPPEHKPVFESILETYPVEGKYTLTDKQWQYMQDYKARQQAKGNGFGYGLVNLKGQSRTLSARYAKDGAEIIVPQWGNPRKITPREAARLMGFPDHLPIVVSNTQAYKQFGNAVVPSVVFAVGERILQVLRENGEVR